MADGEATVVKRKSGGPKGNKHALGNNGGRPRLYQDHASFDAKVEAYFQTDDGMTIPTLSGLCVFMGFSDKESFSTYAAYGEEFSRTVNKTRLRIEACRHKALVAKDTFTPGIIFDLKNNHGWVDKQEVAVTVNHEDRLDKIRDKLNGRRPEQQLPN